MTPHPQRCETCAYFPAGSIFDDRCPYTRYTWRHAGNHPQCKKDPWLASEIWQIPIDVMSELTSDIGCASHSSPPAAPITKKNRIIKNCEATKAREATIRNQTLDAIVEFTKGNSETIEADDGTLEDAVFLGELLAKIESLRTPSTQEQP